jgi:transcriptional regulator GlxA family with amidase domain
MRTYHYTVAAEMFEHDVSKHLALSFRTAKRHFEGELGASAVHYLHIEMQLDQSSSDH